MEEAQHLNEGAAPRQLVRPAGDRWLGGVAAGLAQYFDVPAPVYRIAFAGLALVGGTGILLYLAALLIIPPEGETDSIAERLLCDYRGRPVLLVCGAVLGVTAVVLFSNAALWPQADNAWLVLAVVGSAIIIFDLRNERLGRVFGVASDRGAEPGTNTESPYQANMAAARVARERRRRQPSLFLPVVGVLAVASGVLAVLQVAGVAPIDWRLALAGAVVFTGATIIAGVIWDRRTAGVAVLSIVLLAVMEATVILNIPLRGGIGNEVIRPASVDALNSDYHLAVGTLSLDLSDVDFPAGETHVGATVGIGHLVVTVPRDAVVEVEAHAGLGYLDLPGGQDRGGIRVDRSFVDGGEPGSTGSGQRIVLAARVGAGEVEVVRK
jgi:phage shock protein PspC (stress-responsive transcriptional regulator)